jgi:hypothetical protein
VTRLVRGDSAIFGEDVAKLHRALEELLAIKRAEDTEVEELLESARAQSRSWLAE